MTERWGDSARDRQELDNWITRTTDEADEADPDVHAGWWLVAIYVTGSGSTSARGSVFVIAGTYEQAIEHGIRLVPDPSVIGADTLRARAAPLPGEPPDGWTYRFLTLADAATIPETPWSASWQPVWYPR